MKCKLEVVLSHSTMRGEKAGGEVTAMASDIKITGPVLVKDLPEIFTSEAAFEHFLASAYGEDDQPKFRDIGRIELLNEFEKLTAKIGSAVTTEAQTFKNSRLKNIVLEPRPGRAVEFSATLQVYPTDEQWAYIANLREKTIAFSCSGGKVVEIDEAQASLPLSKEKDKESDAASAAPVH